MNVDEGLVQDRDRAIEQVSALFVTDKQSYEVAESFLKVLQAREKEIKEWFKPTKKSLDDSKKALLAQEKGLLAPIETARHTLRIRMTAWYKAEQEKRAKAEAEMRKAAQASGMSERDAKQMIDLGKPEVKGQRVVWRWEIIDEDVGAFLAWAKALVATSIAEQNGMLWEALEKHISSCVRAHKTDTDIPGVKVVKDYITAVRS